MLYANGAALETAAIDPGSWWWPVVTQLFRHRQEPKKDDNDKDIYKKDKYKDSSLNVRAGDVWEGAAGARGNQPEGDAARAEVLLT